MAAYAAEEAGITWKCPDLSTAVRTKMQLYAYMNAVTRQEDQFNTPDELRDSKRFHQIQITTSAAADGALVKLMNKNFTPENIAIQAALSGFGRLNTITADDREAERKAERIISEAEAETSGADHRPDKPFTYPEDTISSKPKGD